MARRTAKASVDVNLVRRLQFAVSQEPRDAGGQGVPRANELGAPGAPEDSRGMGYPSPPSESVSIDEEGASGATPRRTTLSVPPAVGDQARKLTMAITVAERQDASLGRTLAWALELLEEELRRRGVPVGEHPVRLRSGPRST